MLLSFHFKNLYRRRNSMFVSCCCCCLCIVLLFSFLVATIYFLIVSKNIREAKGLNLPSILEETRLLDKYLEIFVDYTCFS